MTTQKALIISHSRTNTRICKEILGSIGIEFDIAGTVEASQALIKSVSSPYSCIIASRSSLSKQVKSFVDETRSIAAYRETPLILLVSNKDSEEEVKSLYKAGFTQIFGLTEFEQLKHYVEHLNDRLCFKTQRNSLVVVIEDDLGQALVVEAILEEIGCQCVSFESVEETLLEVENLSPDLIISDYFLSGTMTGLDFVLSKSKADHPWFDVPVLAMTAQADSTRKAELIRSGANDYLSKPIEPLDLSLRVENLLRLKYLQDKAAEQQDALQHMAMHDPLTDLYNRHFVKEYVSIHLHEASRHNSDVSIIVLDIDHFKQINDKYGHDVGDKVLIEIASILSADSRGEDVVARIGGEEFIVLMKHCNLDQAVVKAEKLRSLIYEQHPHGLNVTASFGVAQLNRDFDTYDKMFKAADEAVYKAKQKGRNCVVSVDHLSSIKKLG